MRYIVFPKHNIRRFSRREEDDVARGTTGAPRNAPSQDTRKPPAPGSGDPGAGGNQSRSGGSRLIAFVCGRRTKYIVVVFWILVVAALGGLAGKLQGAEKNDASAYLPSSAESTQELTSRTCSSPRTSTPPWSCTRATAG